MKTIVLIVIFYFGFTCLSKADTIDFWHVYYNKEKIHEFGQFESNKVVLKINEISGEDVITVEYFNDTPCYDCETYLFVEDAKHHKLVTSSAKGTFSPISFKLDKLVEMYKEGYMQTFEVFYLEGDPKEGADKKLLFRIKFQ